MENTTETNKTDGVTDFLMRMGILGELLTFFWKRKLYWLIPMMVTLLLFAVIIVLGGTTPAGVFIYSLF